MRGIACLLGVSFSLFPFPLLFLFWEGSGFAGGCVVVTSVVSVALMMVVLLLILLGVGPCGDNAFPGDTRACCTHCIGGHHCVAPRD